MEVKVPYRLCPQVASKLVGKVNKVKRCIVWKMLDPDVESDKGIQRKASDSMRAGSWKDGDWSRTLSLSLGPLEELVGQGRWQSGNPTSLRTSFLKRCQSLIFPPPASSRNSAASGKHSVNSCCYVKPRWLTSKSQTVTSLRIFYKPVAEQPLLKPKLYETTLK